MLGAVAVTMFGSSDEPSASQRNLESEPETEASYDADEFLYKVVTRTNEGVIANIDTENLAVLAVLAADAAIVAFGIDKSRELPPPWGTWANVLLAASALSSFIGYCFGIFRPREPIDPDSFVVDFASDSEQTRAAATLGTIRAYHRNIRERTVKRVSVAFALFFLVIGTVVIAPARCSGEVVRCVQ